MAEEPMVPSHEDVTSREGQYQQGAYFERMLRRKVGMFHRTETLKSTVQTRD